MQVTDAMVAAFCRANPHHHDFSVNEIRTGIDAALAEMWRPIEDAPHETKVLLAYWDELLGRWQMEDGMASWGWRRDGVSNISRHSHATHFMPLPAPPMGK